jgi:hypothetical protein
MILQLAAEVLSRFLRFHLTVELTGANCAPGWSALSGMASDRACDRSGCLFVAWKATTIIYKHMVFLNVSNIEHRLLDKCLEKLDKSQVIGMHSHIRNVARYSNARNQCLLLSSVHCNERNQ